MQGAALAIALMAASGSALADGMPADAAASTLLDETGAGIVPVNDEKALSVRAIEGEIVLALGVKGELEFYSASLDNPDEAVPIALSTDGSTFRLEPPRGKQTVRTRLKLMIPPAMRVRLDVAHSAIATVGADAALTIRGKENRVELVGLTRRADVELEGGSIRIQGAAEGVSLRVRNVETILDGIAGATVIRANGGSARLIGLTGGVQGEFVRTQASIDTVTGPADLTFQEGKARVARLRDGGEIALTACRLELEQAGGAVNVTSDSDVAFADCHASLHIENTSGAVKGMRNDGVLEVKTHHAQVILSQIMGELRIAGDELDVKLDGIGASLAVATKASSILVDGASAVTIENDHGNVVVKRSEAPIEIKSDQGDVRLEDMHGQVTIDAAGKSVAVEWTALGADKDSRISNDAGDVTVTFPPGDCQVSASSKFGRVESNLPGVKVAEGAKSAQGVVGGGSPRTVHVKATGDVRLLGPDAPDASGQLP